MCVCLYPFPLFVLLWEATYLTDLGKLRKLNKHVKCIQTLAGWHGQVKVGTVGAEQFGDFEEWFNYRLSRAAPETCAEFLGSFVADRTNSQFIKGGKWLVWKFEVLYLILSLHKQQA